MLHRSVLSAVLALTLSATFAAEVAPVSGKLTADTALVQGNGAFTMARDWVVRRDGGLLVLEAPEGNARLALLDVPGANAEAALQAAFARYKPGDKHALDQIITRENSGGWDERKAADYRTSPSENLRLQALAMRKGAQWTVMIVDGNPGTLEKRGAAVGQALQSLRFKEYQGESFLGRKAHRLDAARQEQMRAFLLDAMQQLQIPGLSYALMDQGKVVFEGGLGVRELGKADPVDAHTLFMAASNTKGMSTLLLSTLVDEGKLKWNQPVIEVFPAFKLGSAATTAQVQIQHLVCACTGLPRQDLEWIFEFKGHTAEQSLKMLSTNSPTSQFGEVFQYNNLMAAAAGYIGGALVNPGKPLGEAYDAAMEARIFRPLDMRETTFDMARALAANHASGHSRDIDNQNRVVDMGMNFSVVPHRPAGGVWTSAHDLIKYVQLEAAQGKLPDGKQLVSADALLARRKPQVAAGKNKFYGMGLFTETIAGIPTVYHGGSMFGYKSNIYLLPDEGIGAVLLTNSDSGRQLLQPMLRRLLEIVYDGNPEAAALVAVEAKRLSDEALKARSSLVVPADAAIVAQLAAKYTHPLLGELYAIKKDGRLVFDLGEWQSEIATQRNPDGSQSLMTTAPGIVGVKVDIANKDGKRQLVVSDSQNTYAFTEATQ